MKPKNVVQPDSGEKFSLDYKQRGLPSEEKEKKDKADAAGQDGSLATQKGGVKLELSNGGREAVNGRTKPLGTEREKSEGSLLSLFETIRSFVSDTILAIKDFFYKIWYEPQSENEQPETENAETDLEQAMEITEETQEKAEGTSTEAFLTTARTDIDSELPGMDAAAVYQRDGQLLDNAIQPYLRKGDLNQVISLLTDNGKKTIAMNSTLLTYYDRNGRMVEPSPSDRERILHGDRNVRKL